MPMPSSLIRHAIALAALLVIALLGVTSVACAPSTDCDETCPMPEHDHTDLASPDSSSLETQVGFDAPVSEGIRAREEKAASVARATLSARALPIAADSPVAKGRELVENTAALLPEHVGNGLSCKSCHLAAGTAKDAAPFLDVSLRYPQYRPRSGKTDTLADRVNDCFERSLNGRALDEGSAAMNDILAYMRFLSDGVDGERVEGGIPLLELARDPDVARGRALYDAKCIACHGHDGAGIVVDGKTVFPALWGPRSFNIAAGMARKRTAAGFIHAHMPLGQPHTLTREDAWDLAGLVVAMPRPDFAKKSGDWPRGGKPKDAPY
jgi:thiosulfate dehydrogenase